MTKGSNRTLSPGLYGADALRPGDKVDCGTTVVTTDMIDAFAALTGDRFEIHMSDDAAQAHGFQLRVAHGLLVLSVIDGLKNQATAQIKARASLGWDWRFRQPVLAEDRLTVSFTVTDVAPFSGASDQAILTLEFDIRNADDVVVQSGTNRLLAYR